MATVISRMRFGNLRVALYQNDGGNWQFCCWLKEEGKQLRQTTGTAVLEDAKAKAQEIVVDLLAKQKAGQKVLSITLGEVRRAFLLHLDKKVAQGSLTKGTATNIARHVNNGLGYLASVNVTPKTALDGIRASIWSGYVDWRLKTTKVRRDVIQSELVNIRSIFKWAKEQGWCGEASIPTWELQVEKEVAKRRRVTNKEIVEALKAISNWASNKDWHRQMLLTVFRVIYATGMRIGEVLQLKTSDLEQRGEEVIINIRAEASKVKKSRQVILMHSAAIPLLNWMKHHQKSNFIFGETDNKDGDGPFYRTLEKLRADKIIADDLDPVHMRHAYITEMLLRGEAIYLIAHYCGTSVRMIEQTYSHVINQMVGRKFAQKKVIHKDDGSFEVVER